MALGVTAVTIIYVLISALFLYLVPLEKISSDETFVAQAGAVMFGPAGGSTLAALVVFCVVGSMAAFMMSAPRVYYAMAEDGIFLRAVAQLHPKYGTPWVAIIIQGAIASLLVMLGDFQQIISYFIFSAVAFLGLAVASIFVLRRRSSATPDLVLAPGYPATPIAFITLIVVMLALVALHNPRESLVGTLVVLAGLPAYTFFQHNLSVTKAME
jgi:APA family basic amino acid/polyamine antiporter